MAAVSKLDPKVNFWELDGYKKTIERTENGRKMCDFLIKMIEERAGIERLYSEKLSSWYKKWTHAIEKSPEYGTNKEMLKNFVSEGDKLSDVHVMMKDSLLNLVNSKVKNWKDENYRKQLCMSKPASTYKSGFEKAQKPWAQQNNKVERLKKEYYKYCQQSNEALAQESTVQRTDEAAYQKSKERCRKLTASMDSLKQQYQEAARELEELKPTYVTEMNNVFAAAQEFEIKRLEFFKEILTKLQENLQLSKNSSAQEIYKECKEHISHSDPRSDTQWWAENYGTGTALIAHLFQDFSPDVLEMINQGRQRMDDEPPTVFPLVEQPPESVVRAEVVPPPPESLGHTNALYSTINQHGKKKTTELESEFDADSVSSNPAPAEINRRTEEMSQGADYGAGVYSTLNDGHIYNNEGGIPDDPCEGSQIAGTKVKALYDFDGEERDELSFKQDEVFHKIKDKDENGWATGEKDGKIGLFPDTYAVPC